MIIVLVDFLDGTVRFVALVCFLFSILTDMTTGMRSSRSWAEEPMASCGKPLTRRRVRRGCPCPMGPFVGRFELGAQLTTAFGYEL